MQQTSCSIPQPLYGIPISRDIFSAKRVMEPGEWWPTFDACLRLSPSATY